MAGSVLVPVSAVVKRETPVPGETLLIVDVILLGEGGRLSARMMASRNMLKN